MKNLLQKVRANDKCALNFLMDRYKDVVNMKVSKYYISGAERDDIVQEGLIGLYKAVKNFDKENKIHLKHLQIFA